MWKRNDASNEPEWYKVRWYGNNGLFIAWTSLCYTNWYFCLCCVW